MSSRHDGTRDVAWLIGGKTGEGVDSAGEIFARAAARDGANVRTFRLFPPIIKGGPTSYEVRTAAAPLYARADQLDCIVALDGDTAARHGPDLRRGGLLLADVARPAPLRGGGAPSSGDGPQRARTLQVPFTALAATSGTPS